MYVSKNLAHCRLFYVFRCKNNGSWMTTKLLHNLQILLSRIMPWVQSDTSELLRQQVAKFYGKEDVDSLGKAIGTGWSVMAVISIIILILSDWNEFVKPARSASSKPFAFA